jgi:predicted RNase H-like HicB family nuclease
MDNIRSVEQGAYTPRRRRNNPTPSAVTTAAPQHPPNAPPCDEIRCQPPGAAAEWILVQLSAAPREGPVKQTRQLTAVIEREGDGYVALCPQVDIASQGANVEEAKANLIEAIELFFDTADPSEIASRLRGEV